MNTELFIARRIVSSRKDENRISRPIVSIAIIGIALGVAAMIITTATVTGFKNQIRDKVIGFGSHIQILNFDSNVSFETAPISKGQEFLPELKDLYGIKYIQVFGTKAGIIKSGKEIQGVVLKGVGTDFHWDFFEDNLVEGSTFRVNDSTRSNLVMISKYLSDLLLLGVDDSFVMYFIQDPPRMRKFTVAGIYETNLVDFDKLYILADIGHIQRLNNWSEDQVSGFEIALNNFNRIDEMAWLVQDIVGFEINEAGERLRVSSITDQFPQIFDWLNLQDMNVVIILVLIFLVAGFNMVSSLLILILERTNMIGILKALGTRNWSIRKVFLYQSAFLISKGLLWGNLLGIGLALIQFYFGIIKLDPSTYYLTEVPINIDIATIVGINAGTLLLTTAMLIVPSYLVSRISPVKTIRFN
jgi:lipoprotein-releasing system permease protein